MRVMTQEDITTIKTMSIAPWLKGATDQKRREYFEMLMQPYRELAIWRLQRSTGPRIKVRGDGKLSFEDSEDQREIMEQLDQVAQNLWHGLGHRGIGQILVPHFG